MSASDSARPHQAPESRVPETPFGKKRPNPFALSPPSRFPALRLVARAGSIIAGLSVTTAGGCGLVAGGMHGVAFAVALFSAMSMLGMTLALLVAALVDSSNAVKQGLEGRTFTGDLIERGAGHLSEPTPKSDGTLARTDEVASRP